MNLGFTLGKIRQQHLPAMLKGLLMHVVVEHASSSFTV